MQVGSVLGMGRGLCSTSWTGRDDHLTEDGRREGRTVAIGQARAQEEASQRLCRYCGTWSSPGHMHEGEVYQGWAERYLGVVH